MLSGAEALADALQRAGVTHVFGLPGTQNASLFSALARTPLRTVLTGSELAAAFMANGFHRAGGGVPVVAAIPGPGFTYALTGLAEAAHDNAAFVLLTGEPGDRDGRFFGLQALDQAGMVRGLARSVLRLEHSEDALPVLQEALHQAVANGPGPVVVEIAGGLLGAPAPAGWSRERAAAVAPMPDPVQLREVAARLREARRVVVLAGQGTLSCPGALAELIRRRPAMVLTTVSARGVLPESHPWSLAHDFLACSVPETNRLLAEADLVLMLGCRTTHNGTGGYGLILPEASTVQVDLDPEVLAANYSPRWTFRCTVADYLAAVLAALDGEAAANSQWDADDVATWRGRLRERSLSNPPEPRFAGVPGETASAFFAALQAAFPADAILVTDTGQHQIMARQHLRVESPRGLLVPADFQSMGFGLPAAIGAALAAPERRVVALLGDGGLMMVGLELATAVREGIDLAAIVFRDGYLGQIRAQQSGAGIGEAAVKLASLDLAALAAATGAHYLLIEDDAPGVLQQAAGATGVVLVDLPLGDSPAMLATRWRGQTRQTARRTLGRRGIELLRRIIGRS